MRHTYSGRLFGTLSLFTLAIFALLMASVVSYRFL